MTKKLVSGVYAAVLTPRNPDGSIDEAALTDLIRFLAGNGIFQYAMNGATGEFCLTTADQLRVMLAVAQEAGGGQAQILCGVGAAGLHQACELAAVAEEGNVHGLLLPTPYYFSYAQEDLEAFARAVAGSTSRPILLYNLPQFSSGLEKETVLRLIREVPNIAGLKDSSGHLDILRYLTEHAPDSCRIVGNDGALVQALKEGVCDGVISGVAGVLPEALLSLYGHAAEISSESFLRAGHLLEEFIDQLNVFPTPWGLKHCVQARGIGQPGFAQPQAEHRRRQAAAFAAWFHPWYADAFETLQ